LAREDKNSPRDPLSPLFISVDCSGRRRRKRRRRIRRKRKRKRKR
jgi:hypothetical protein